MMKCHSKENETVLLWPHLWLKLLWRGREQQWYGYIVSDFIACLHDGSECIINNYIKIFYLSIVSDASLPPWAPLRDDHGRRTSTHSLFACQQLPLYQCLFHTSTSQPYFSISQVDYFLYSNPHSHLDTPIHKLYILHHFSVTRLS